MRPPAPLRAALPLLLLALGACLPAPDGTAGPDAGSPGAPAAPSKELAFIRGDERLMLVLVNRARADPQAELAGCSQCADRACYGVRPPLMMDYRLWRAARFHAAHLRLANRGLSHDSLCTLVPDLRALFLPDGSCAGEAACACVGGNLGCAAGGCTSTFERFARFDATGTGENVAMASQGSAEQVFYLWLHEPDADARCDFRPANGHRYNLLHGVGPALGVGRSETHWVQDFGGLGREGKLVEGALWGQDFLANWYDPQGGAPRQARVNVEGTCTALTRERGTPGHGTWRGRAEGTGCRRYVFEFVDSQGSAVTLPLLGSYATGCAADWVPERPAPCP